MCCTVSRMRQITVAERRPNYRVIFNPTKELNNVKDYKTEVKSEEEGSILL